jgi:hypothetical protein
MSLETNKEIVRRVLEEFWHRGDEGVLDELFADDYVNHELSNPEVRGLENYKQWARGVRSAWSAGAPDWRSLLRTWWRKVTGLLSGGSSVAPIQAICSGSLPLAGR